MPSNEMAEQRHRRAGCREKPLIPVMAIKTATKRICLALTLMLSIAAAVALVCKKPPLPQIVSLPNGEQFRFAGVTYGTKHVQPNLAARLISHLPSSLASFVQRKLGRRPDPFTSFTLPEPSLVIWFQRLGTNAPSNPGVNCSAMLADQDGVVTANESSPSLFGGGYQWTFEAFGVVPRRSRVLQCILFDYKFPQSGSSGGVGPEIGRVRFPNPLYDRFPQWQPQPLPLVKPAGDVEVRLQDFITGVLVRPYVNTDYRPGQKGEGVSTLFDLSLKSRGTNEVWEIASADLSDATGNRIHAMPNEGLITGPNRSSFKGVLPPDEAAWRLKVELKRTFPYPEWAGFAAWLLTMTNQADGLKLVSFTNVPLLSASATNMIWRTNAVGEVPIVLREFMQESGGGSGTPTRGKPKFRVEPAGGLPGTWLDFVRVTTDTGEAATTVQKLAMMIDGTGLNSSARSYRFVVLPSVPAGVKTVNLTWAMQKMRSVEFLVKPRRAE